MVRKQIGRNYKLIMKKLMEINMTGLDVVLLPEELKEKDLSECLIVVIDVLRASSTITTALASGADRVIPVYNPKEAQERVKHYPNEKALLCGERNGEKLAGFDLGNSPLEYKDSRIKGKTILLTTTNGIRTIDMVKKAKSIIIGCFLNSRAVAEYCISYPGKVLIVCAGDRGNISLEDTVCAGMIVDELYLNNINRNCEIEHYNDDLLIASFLCREFGNNLSGMLEKSVWGKHLIAMGLKEDINFCAQKDIYRLIPVIMGDSIVNNELPRA